MSTPPPVVPAPPRGGRSGLAKRALLLVAAAFGLGLLLFGLLWLDKRNDNDFFRADAPPPGQATQEFEPLPTPGPGNGRDGKGETWDELDARREPVTGQIEEGFPTPDSQPVYEPVAPPPSAPPSAPAQASASTSAQPIHSPRPRFPPRALQRGESGSILLQVQVDAQGNPAEVDVVQSSRSRDLDREAVRAVRQWRFRPATRDGAPIASKVLIPIDFSPGR